MIPYTLNLAHQSQIDEICKSLPNLGLKYISMTILFNDKTTLVLSNAFSLLELYYKEGWSEKDYCGSKEFQQIEKGYYLWNEMDSMSSEFRSLLAEKNIYPVYTIIRSHAECNFVFTAMSDKLIVNSQAFYEKNIKKFENFCVKFVNHLLKVIVQAKPSYKYSFIFNNASLREAVIKQGYAKKPSITERGQECLSFSARGKSGKEIAKELGISPYTVETYLKHVREELNCHTLTEAVVEGINRGIIGKFSRFDS